MRSQHAMPCAADAEPATAVRAVLRVAGWSIGLGAAVGIVTFAALSLPRPLDTVAESALRAVVGLSPQGPKQQPDRLPRHPDLEVTNALSSGSLSLQKRTAISALATTAAALLALGFALSRALILSPAITPSVRHVAPPAAKGPWPRKGASFMARASEPLPKASSAASLVKPLTLDGIGLSTQGLIAIEPREPDDAIEKPRSRYNPPATTAKALIERVLADSHAPDLAPHRDDRSVAPPVLTGRGACNDLRSYLQRPTALRTPERHTGCRPKRDRRDKVGQESVRPPLKSFEAVLTNIRARAAANTAGAILVAAGATSIDATGEAIRIARILLASTERSVLVDLSRGRVAVSGRLALPRAPGFADLLAGRAGFEEVIHVDSETALQVIPAGHPTVRSEGNEIERAIGIFDALAQAYDVVVFHGDRDGTAQMGPALAGRLSVAVAVLGTRMGPRTRAVFAELGALGCPVVAYERQDEDEGLGRATAV